MFHAIGLCVTSSYCGFGKEKYHTVELNNEELKITALVLDKSTGTAAENCLWLCDDNGKSINLIAVLNRNQPYITTDLSFANKTINFTVIGDTNVHLVGYVTSVGSQCTEQISEKELEDNNDWNEV